MNHNVKPFGSFDRDLIAFPHALATDHNGVVELNRVAAAIAEAAGELVQLPAVLTTDGVIRPCTTAEADALLGTITADGGSQQGSTVTALR